MRSYKRKALSVVLAVVALMPIIATPTARSAPMPINSYYTFQPDGTPYHYYSFGDEIFYHVAFDSIDKSQGFLLERMPRGTVSDGWQRDTVPINGTYQYVNARYKQDVLDQSIYPETNREMLLAVTIADQNGPALFDEERGEITLYMNAGANLIAPEMGVVVTSLGYRHFQGPVWWSLTNDIGEKEELYELYRAGIDGDRLFDRSSWDDFSDLFNASMENEADLSKETWLTVCGGTIGGYFRPVFAQYKILCTTDENPLLNRPVLAPRAVEFDKRLLYQAHALFSVTDYTKKPESFLIDGTTPPEGAITYSDFMCVVSREYLASVETGETLLLTVTFNDGTSDTVNISIHDTTEDYYEQLFNDVGTDTTAWEFIHPLVSKGIIDSGSSEYRPDDNVTYEEFFSMLKGLGVQVETPESPLALMMASEAEELLFSSQTPRQYEALNKQSRWLVNTHEDLTADDFLFFDKIWPKLGRYYIVDVPDMNRPFSRVEAAAAILRFVNLSAYADDLIEYHNPTAYPTSATILLDGQDTTFDAYHIDGNNYFKLRDLAFMLDGTAKQFSVDYNEVTQRITLTPGEAYIVVGGEMESKGNDPQPAFLSRIFLSMEGRNHRIFAYNIGGNNYLKLRDIAALIDFGVGWDGTNDTITIDTEIGYTQGVTAHQPRAS